MTTMDVRPEAAKGSEDKRKAPKWGAVARGGSYWSWLMAIEPVAALAIGWRTYQQVFAFKYGLDSHNSDFNKYWLTLALVNMTVLPAAAGVWYVWMWVDEFGLGTVTLQDELHNFLAEFESGAPAADNGS